MVPTLRVLKKLPGRQSSISAQTKSMDLSDRKENEEELNSESSTYQLDFKKPDYDICMSKAYNILATKLNKFPSNPNEPVKTAQQAIV